MCAGGGRGGGDVMAGYRQDTYVCKCVLGEGGVCVRCNGWLYTSYVCEHVCMPKVVIACCIQELSTGR